jgi:hypothetical protein
LTEGVLLRSLLTTTTTVDVFGDDEQARRSVAKYSAATSCAEGHPSDRLQKAHRDAAGRNNGRKASVLVEGRA